MSRYIDADKIPYVISENGCLDDFAYRYDINEVPTADVVEVVRCKDCRYSYVNHKGYLGCTLLASSLEWVEPTGYCSLGERKEDGI